MDSSAITMVPTMTEIPDTRSETETLTFVENRGAIDDVDIEKCIHVFQKANGDKMAAYKPKTRPFRIKFEPNNGPLNYLFYKHNNHSEKGKHSRVSVSIDLNYYQNIFNKIKQIEDEVIEFVPTVSDFDVLKENYVSSLIDKNSNRFHVYMNRFKKDTGDNYLNPVRVFQNEEQVFFDSNEAFLNYIKNKKAKISLDIYFEPVKNLESNSWNLQSHVYSITFHNSLTDDMSIRVFNNNMTFEERKQFCESIIVDAIKNNELKDKSIPLFQFSNFFFDFPTINMKEDYNKYIHDKVYEPKLWLGKKTRYDPSSNAKESVNIVATHEIEMFLKNLTEVLEFFLPEFTAALSKRKVKQSKKESYTFVMPLTEHYDGEYKTMEDNEDDCECFVKTDENKPPLKIVNIKQPWYAEDDAEKYRWDNLPSRLNYKIATPRVYVNKVWLNEKGSSLTNKKLILQLSFSKYLSFNLVDNKNRMENNGTVEYYD